MKEIEIVHTVTQTKQDLLDIHQYEIIGIYEKLILSENILQYFMLRNRNGCMFWFEFKNGKARFTGCDPDYRGTHFNETIDDQFYMNLIYSVKGLLHDWHTRKRYPTNIRRRGLSYILCTCPHEPTTGVELTHQERGALTKILRLYNKRKRFTSTVIPNS